MFQRACKTLSALSAVALVAAAVTVVHGAGDPVKASAPVLNAGKGDRLDLRPVGPRCSQQAWPHYEAACVKDRRNAFGRAITVPIVTAEKRL